MNTELVEAFQKEIAKKHGMQCCANFKEVDSFDVEAGNIFDLPPFESFEADKDFYIQYQILNDESVLYKVFINKPPALAEYYTATSQHQ